jgi:alkylation response protein AidB-like acyl-CoA dehydrogenase
VDIRFETLRTILPGIRGRATALDRSGGWPEEDLAELAGVGASRWFVPVEFGGEGLDALELHLRYEAIASASLSAALIISQRDSAVGMIAGSGNERVRQQLLPALARNEIFATIGISHLTTSRQGGLAARGDGTDYVLRGAIPWCTGAGKAKVIVAGAVCEDGRQILFALPTDSPGVKIHSPMELVALRSTWTARVELEDVRLEGKNVLRGPVAKAMAGSSKGIPLGQTFLAFGLCRGTLELMAMEGSQRARAMHARFAGQLEALHAEVLEIAKGKPEENTGPGLRAACNDLALRATQGLVTLQKGSSLLLDHPAQRLAREAMFFLVWSCTDPVIDCMVDVLSAD